MEDAQLASLTLNGQSLELTPTTVNAQYRFQGQLSLPEGELADLTLVARDRAANQTSLSYSLLADSPVSLQIISPAQGSAFSQSSQPQAIEILARAAGLNERHSVQLVPSHRTNQTRFHGILAPNSRYRERVTLVSILDMLSRGKCLVTEE